MMPSPTEPSTQTIDCNTIDPHPTDPDATVKANGRTLTVRHVCPTPPKAAPPPRPKPLDTVEPTNGLEATLLRWPERVQRVEEAHWNATRARQGMKDALAVMEAKKVTSIAQDVNDAGKPRYSNEAARDAQLQISLAADLDYQNLRGQVLEMDETLGRLDRELRRCEMEFKAAYGIMLSRARLTMEVKF